MSSDFWDKVGELVDEALAVPPEKRAAYLDQACGDDAELRRELEAQLALEGRPEVEGFLGRPIVAIRSGDEPGSREGGRIGPYELRRRIGRGGMGAVYLAVHRDDELGKEVALKLLRRGLENPELARRLAHEREILSSLVHPNIARLHAGGTSDDGEPYFVMEHVEGQPIDLYCNERRLSVRERLGLFRKVCAAVHFAHQSLVVHRDLKPGNILVDGDGEPKLLDFGIAKLLPPETSAHDDPTQQLLTAPGVQPMTLRYASPEQVEGQPITTATDVYSLGVVLYELLTGRWPYRPPSRSPLDVANAIHDKDPERPSTAVQRRGEEPWPAGDGTATADVSRFRTGDPAALRRALAGDVDAILLMALDKDPRRRYASVQQLSEDLRRYLEGLPVLARRPTFSYQLGKFVRRHKLETALAAAVLALIAGFGVTAMVLREEAIRQREQAEEVAEIFTDVFQGQDPRQARRRARSVDELLERAVETIIEETAGEDEDRPVLLEAIAAAYMGLELYEEAEPYLERARWLRRQDRDMPHGESRLVTTLVYSASVERARGKQEQAADLEREALAALEEGAADSRRLARVLSNHATVLEDLGELAGAEDFYRAALDMKRRLCRADDPDGASEIAVSEHNLGAVLAQLGEFEEAKALLSGALAKRERFLGREDAATLRTLGSLGVLLLNMGALEEGEPVLRDNLRRRIERSGPQAPSAGIAHTNLALLLQKLGAWDEAEHHYGLAWPIFVESFGAEHPNVAQLRRNLASLLLAADRYAEAEAEIRAALATLRRQRPAGHWQIADAGSVLGELLAATDRLAEAEPLLVEGCEILKEIKGAHARQTREACARRDALLGAAQSRQQVF